MTVEKPTGSAAEGVQTFLIADIRGYTRYTAEHGDEAAAALASRFADIVRGVAESRDGRLIELRGDEALVAFTSARQAIRAAVELQAETRELPRGIGVGIEAGEAVPVAEGYRGGALNLAARLCALAGPGEVLASETVVQLARAIDGIRYGHRRAERVKGIAKPVVAIEVYGLQGVEHAGRLRALRRRARRLWRRRDNRIVIVIALAVVGCAVGLFTLLGRGSPSGAATGPLQLTPNSLASIDPATHRVASDIHLRGSPQSVTTGSGRAWVLSANGRLLSSVTRNGQALRSFALQGAATDQWAGAGTADTANDFVAQAGSNGLSAVSQAIGGDAGAALSASAPITPWRTTATDAACAPYVTGSGTFVWFSRGRRLAKIDGSTGSVLETRMLPQQTNAPRSITCYGVRYSGGRLLAARSPDASIGVVDPTSGAFHAIKTGIRGVSAATGSDEGTPWAATAHSLWIADGTELLNVDLATGKTLAHLPIGRIARLAISPTGAIWALGQGGRELVQVDPTTNSVVERIPIATSARDIAIGFGRIWIATGPS